MRTSRLAATAALCLVSSAALAETRNLDVSAFDRVDVATGITAIITQADTQSLSVTADSDIFDQIDIKVHNGELVAKRRIDLIAPNPLKALFSRDEVVLNIAVPALSELTASSGAAISADFANGKALAVDASSGANIDISSAMAASVSLNASSGAHISASGTCSLIDVDVSSGASVRAGDLICENAHVDGSSGASAELSATGAVNGSVSSGGTVRLATEPASVDVESSSGGNLRIH